MSNHTYNQPHVLKVLVFLKAQVIKSWKRLKNGAWCVRYVRNGGNCCTLISAAKIAQLSLKVVQDKVLKAFENVKQYGLHISVKNNMPGRLRFVVNCSLFNHAPMVQLGTIEITTIGQLQIYVDGRTDWILQPPTYSLRSVIATLLRNTSGNGRLSRENVEKLRSIAVF